MISSLFLLEHNPDLLYAYRHSLETHGYSVAAFSHDIEALETIQRLSSSRMRLGFALVDLVDSSHPFGGGIDVLQSLYYLLPTVPRLVISTYTREERPLSVPCNWLQKPFGLHDVLLPTIQRILASR